MTEPALPADSQPALTHAATRAALRRGALRGAWLLALAIAMVAAAILLARDDPRRYRSLFRHGTETTGLVRSVDSTVDILRSIRVDYFVLGVRHTTTVWLPLSAKRRHRGEAIPVVYRTERPSEATVVGEWNVPWWRRMIEWGLGIWAIIPLFAALAVLPVLWRTRRALRHRPWVASPYDLYIAGRKGPVWLTLTGAAPFGLDIRLTVLAAPFRLGPFRSHPPACVSGSSLTRAGCRSWSRHPGRSGSTRSAKGIGCSLGGESRAIGSQRRKPASHLSAALAIAIASSALMRGASSSSSIVWP